MFKRDDIVNYKKFKSIVDAGMFNIKGNAAIQVALLYKWFNELEQKIVDSVGKQDLENEQKKEKK